MLGIGVQSYVGRDDGLEVYKAMLNLKIVWSTAAILGLFVSIAQGAPDAAWAFMSAFIAFAGVWIHYRIRFKQLAGAPVYPDIEAD